MLEVLPEKTVNSIRENKLSQIQEFMRMKDPFGESKTLKEIVDFVESRRNDVTKVIVLGEFLRKWGEQKNKNDSYLEPLKVRIQNFDSSLSRPPQG